MRPSVRPWRECATYAQHPTDRPTVRPAVSRLVRPTASRSLMVHVPALSLSPKEDREEEKFNLFLACRPGQRTAIIPRRRV